MSAFTVYHQDGTEVHEGDQITSFRGEPWTFGGCWHPRKIFVWWKKDPEGDDSYPNKRTMEYFASVFNLGIRDEESGIWTSEPGWIQS